MKKDDIIKDVRNFTEDLKAKCEVKDSFFSRYLVLFKRPRLLLFIVIYFVILLLLNKSRYNTFYIQYNFAYTIAFFIRNLIVFFITINISLSNILEKIILWSDDTRHVAMNEEKNRLFPIFDEIYQKAKHNNKYLSSKIKLYIIDTATITAFSYTKSIVISRGVIDTMNDDELKSIIAHELSHISNFDTHLNMILKFGMNTYLYIFYIINFLLKKLVELLDFNFVTGLLGSIINVIRTVLELVVNLVIYIFTLIACGSRRKQEYKADNCASHLCDISYIVSALKKIYDMEVNDKIKLSQRVMREHPRTAYRIERLEQLEQLQDTQS